MATIGEVQQQVTEVAQVQAETTGILSSLRAKIEEIRLFIGSLRAGVPVTQQQLDELFASLDSIKVVSQGNKGAAEAALAETDSLDA